MSVCPRGPGSRGVGWAGRTGQDVSWPPDRFIPFKGCFYAPGLPGAPD